MRLVTCAAGAAWEAPFVRHLQQRKLKIEILRRCVDYADLLATVSRDHPDTALISAELPWLDRDLVANLGDVGTVVVAIETDTGKRPLDRMGISDVFPAEGSVDDLVSLLTQLKAPDVSEHASEINDSTSLSAPLIAVWGPGGAPGRTTVATHLALEEARSGKRVVLIDADVWNAAIAQLLGLKDAPSIAHVARQGADGWPQPFSDFLQEASFGLQILAGLPRADLWTEVREQAWRAVLRAAQTSADLVICDVAGPIEEDEELSFDRVPFRRNLVTRVTLEEASEILFVLRADPIGVRHGLFAAAEFRKSFPHQQLLPILNRAPRDESRIRECSREIERQLGEPPKTVLPVEDHLEQSVWEGRPLQEINSRSRFVQALSELIGQRVS